MALGVDGLRSFDLQRRRDQPTLFLAKLKNTQTERRLRKMIFGKQGAYVFPDALSHNLAAGHQSGGNS